MSEFLELLIIGAGPTGLACGIEAHRAGLRFVIVDKGCLVNSLVHYPPNMTFFTSHELLEIGNLPFPSTRVKPVREDALEYYRTVADHFRLALCFYERVVTIQGRDDDFQITTETAHSEKRRYHSRKVVIATGYYDLPNRMGIPGEDLPKVSHYYTGPHEFYQQQVAVIGGSNSAAEAALDLYRHGARVTLIHRRRDLASGIKYWVKPDIENRIKEGVISTHFESRTVAITPETVQIENAQGVLLTLENNFVFALTGYHPDANLLRQAGVEVDPKTLRPKCNPETLESNVPGIYLAGVIIAGSQTNELFIENGRFHGGQIIQDLQPKLRGLHSGG